MEITSTTLDDQIKRTFDMLVERISNIEERVERISILEEHVERQHRAAVFAECCKYGYLNNETLGFPFSTFSIERSPQYSPPNSPRCKPSCKAMTIHITTSPCDCRKNLPWVVHEVAGVEMADLFNSLDTPHPHPYQIGWMESRFRCAENEAYQRFVDSTFASSPFKCTLLTADDDSMLFALGTQTPGRLDKFLEQIPTLVQAMHHVGVNCIEKVTIRETLWDRVEMTQTLQYAANLPTGPLKDRWVLTRKREFTELMWDMFTDDCSFGEIEEVRRFSGNSKQQFQSENLDNI